MQFQVNEQDFFLAFAEQEKRFYVFVPTATGMHRIPVYVDAAEWERVGEFDRGMRKIQ